MARRTGCTLTKRCPRCKLTKPVSQFHKNKNKPDGLSYACKACTNKQIKAKRNRNKDRIRELLSKFNLTREEYNALVRVHQGRCAICGGNDTVRPLQVDHCHSSGRVRGLLCMRCNLGLGWFRDNPELLRKAANYIEESEDA